MPSPYSSIEIHPEIAVWWSIAIMVVIARYIIRLIRTSWRLEAPDWIMILAVLVYTAALSLTNISGRGFQKLNTKYSLTEVAMLSPENLQLWSRYGIITFTAELCNVTTQYLIKACLLIVYHRLTKNRRTNFYNKLAAAYTFLAWVLIMVLDIGVWCQPVWGYWTLSVIQEKPHCTVYTRHHITVLVFGVTSDILIILIPIPMLLKAQFTTLRKALLISIFGMGVFSMTACIFSRLALITYASRKNDPNQKNFNKDWPLWMARELSSAVIVGNIYYLAPIVKIFETWVLRYKTKRKGGIELQDSPAIVNNSPRDSDETRIVQIHIDNSKPSQNEEGQV